MKHFIGKLSFCLAGIAALLGPLPAHAQPLFSPLLKPASLAALLSPPSPPVLKPALPLWALGSGSLWSRTLDPSLRLTDWQHVFDIATLGAFDIPLRDDPAERTNILLSAQAVDNVTVAPGEEFSFNTQVGERTPERGYQDGLMFDNGHVVRGTGGGICLVATGLYNAALQAGLEITERHPHSGLVSYAPPGCDAGIVYGLEDMKFRNTTARPVVVRTEVADDHVTIALFGQTPPPGAQVIVKPTSLTPIPYAIVTQQDSTLLPGQVVVDQKPRTGYAVVVTRFWLQGERVLRHEIVADERRAPRNKIVRVAPALIGPVSPTGSTPLPDWLTPNKPALDNPLPDSGLFPVAPPSDPAPPRTDAETGD